MIISNAIIDAAVKDDPLYWYKILQRVFDKDDGKLALLWFVNNAGFGDTFTDPLLEAQNAGRRGLIAELLQILKVDLSTLVVNDQAEDLLDRILEN